MHIYLVGGEALSLYFQGFLVGYYLVGVIKKTSGHHNA